MLRTLSGAFVSQAKAQIANAVRGKGEIHQQKQKNSYIEIKKGSSKNCFGLTRKVGAKFYLFQINVPAASVLEFCDTYVPEYLTRF